MIIKNYTTHQQLHPHALTEMNVVYSFVTENLIEKYIPYSRTCLITKILPHSSATLPRKSNERQKNNNSKTEWQHITKKEKKHTKITNLFHFPFKLCFC